MIVHGVGAAVEVLGDHADGVADDELIEDLVLTIGEPGLGIGDFFECGVGLA